MSQPTITYKEWNQSLLCSTTKHVLNHFQNGTVDLRECLFLLPTRQAGRRLREALAFEINKQDGAIFPPMTATPWHVVRPVDDAASNLTCLRHWSHTLENTDLREFRHLFPSHITNKDFAWRRQMARTLHDLRGNLAEGGLDFAAVADENHCPEEPLRWRNLKQLEAIYRKSLGKQIDLHDAKRIAATQPDLPGIGRVTLLGVPDLPAIVQQALEILLTDGIQVEVVIFGPKDGAKLFDTWGRPLPKHWSERKFPLSDDQLIPCIDEYSQAAEVAARLSLYDKSRSSFVAAGVADTAVVPALERALTDAKITFFNPNGRPLRHAPIFTFLKALQSVLQQPTFANAEALLRLPDAWGWAHTEVEKFSPTLLLTGLDELRQQHLPASLSDAIQLYFEGDFIGPRIHARKTLEALKKALDTVEETPLSTGLTEFLKTTFTERNFTEGSKDDAADLETARQFMAQLNEWETALGEEARPHPYEALTMILEEISHEAVFPERPTNALDIQGWLELEWEDAPHLIIAGANEGNIPESVHGDRFLPETLCERLGLRTNDDRFARDAWLLELLLKTRANEGRVDVLLGRQRANGDPLKPSRLLFRCPEKELPPRIQHLFTELPLDEQPPAWNVPWPLQIENITPVEKIGVTSIANYLTCPYRFYLRHVLRMEMRDFEQRELDARGFGTLVHDVLDAFGKDKKASKLKDPGVINSFFVAELKKQVGARFGKHPPLPVRVQTMIAERRLYQVAIVQAQARREGWEIIKVEDKFKIELDGLFINGRIDCVEKNKTTGAVRVLDFKTSNIAKEPASQHFKIFREKRDGEVVRPYAQFNLNEKTYHWTNLQLPLYAWALEGEFESDISVGYFNLPTLGTDTGIALLEPFDREIMDSALMCAHGVVQDIKANRFWPPTQQVTYDDFADILFGQPEVTAIQPGIVQA